jgi:hypothetical protein
MPTSELIHGTATKTTTTKRSLPVWQRQEIQELLCFSKGSSMSQPKWKCVGNLGDVDPITHGGILVYIDETGVYPPEVEVIEPYKNENHDSDYDQDYQDEDDPDPEFAYDEELSEELHWTIHRVILERCTWDAETGVLSDNKYHPQHAAWFAKPESKRAERPQDTTYLREVCNCMDMDQDELIKLFCSDDPLDLAEAYSCVAGYHGWHEFDHYPLDCKNRKEIEERYADDLKELKEIRRS